MLDVLTATPTIGLFSPPEWVEWWSILPGSVAAFTALVLILLDVFHRGDETPRDYQAYVGAIGLGIMLVTCWFAWEETVSTPVFHGTMYVDQFMLFFSGLFAAAGIVALLMSPAYLRSRGMERPEYYILILTSVSGMSFLAGAADFLTFFVAFEVMSIPVYCIAGFLRRESRGAESALKYFILGAFSSAVMLYGIALLYGATGTTNFEIVGQQLTQLMANGPAATEASTLIVIGLLLVLSGFAFKIASVPFHLWTPDVYTGSPTPAVGFMATAVKASAFAPLIRVFTVAFNEPVLRGGFFGYGWVDVFVFIAAASMILGNLVAITQDNVKRMLAYSTIAHAGYLLVGFVAAGARPEFFIWNEAVLFYLVAYTFGTLGAFGVLAYFNRKGRAVETYDDLNGTALENPSIGLMMGVFMFSSAGIPPTAGFVAKLYVFRSAVQAEAMTGEMTFIGLAVLGVLSSVAGIYYYLRVLVHMYMKEPRGDVEPTNHSATKFALAVCAVLSLYLGILPGTATDLSGDAIRDFAGAPDAVQQSIEDDAVAMDEEAAESRN